MSLRRRSHSVGHWVSDVLDRYKDWYEHWRGSALGNVVWGAAWGLFLAACFTVIAAVPALIRAFTGPAHVWQKGLSFFAIIGVYLFGGIIGGALVGLLRPVSRWWVGRRLIGVVVAVPVGIAIRYTVYGWHSWTTTELENWTITTIIWGLAMSFAPEPYVREYWAERDRVLHGRKRPCGTPRSSQVRQANAGDDPTL